MEVWGILSERGRCIKDEKMPESRPEDALVKLWWLCRLYSCIDWISEKSMTNSLTTWKQEMLKIKQCTFCRWVGGPPRHPLPSQPPRCSSGANAGESAICPELDISFRHMWEWIFLISSISLQLLATDGNFWQLMATSGYWWQLMATYGNFWQLLATDGGFWQLLATYVNFWQLTATFGNRWKLLANFGNLWLLWQLMASPLVHQLWCITSSASPLVLLLRCIFFLNVFVFALVFVFVCVG